ncbi:hypothetical protein Rhe02_58880 [Rhizocola hellebori]|uniref:DUF6458 domain-containing protein n=1 Tax=Rhizocola hellebori TaxID=1392758 RepID=A0A8J3QEG7_9ACTN|nr:DUF6458 family protein [Rhizocola hellebori]GIH07821.1 hypothetical protein Rhe02_58880 [Rhizocola hellebori]
MGIGIGIFLIALGAILTFAVDWSIEGLDLNTVGWILMLVGVGGLILFFYFWNRRRVPQAVTAIRQRQVADAPRTYDDPTPPPRPTVSVMTPQSPAPATMFVPQPPAPVTMLVPQPPQAPVATVTATAPVVLSSRARPDGD